MPAIKKYTHIFFDLDNTLWDFERNSRSAMKITYDHFNLGTTGVEFSVFFETYSRHNNNLWAAYRKKEVVKKELIRQRFQSTFDEFGIVDIDPEKMNAFYLNEMPNQIHLMKGVQETLEYLFEKKYRMYIITNGFKEVQHKKLKTSGLYSFFKKIYISEEVKTPKPGKAIFEYAIKSSNAKKKQSLMVGDDWEVDILGATNIGIDAIFVSNADNIISDKIKDSKQRKTEVYNVLNIKEIKNIL